MNKIIFLILLLIMLDNITTYFALSLGAIEQNFTYYIYSKFKPFTHLLMFIHESSFFVSIFVIADKLKNRNRDWQLFYKIIKIAFLTLLSFAVFNNIIVILRYVL